MRAVSRSLLSAVVALAVAMSTGFTAVAEDQPPTLAEGASQTFELPGGGEVQFQPSDSSANGATVEVQPIDIEGATATTPDGTVTAIGTGVSIVATTPNGETVERVEHDVVIEAATEDAPGYVSSLTPGIELEFPVDPADLEGLDLSTLGVYSREDANDEWTWVPSAYDPERGAVVAQSDHLSEFTVMAAPAAVTSPAIPRIALDPDDNVGRALWAGEVRGELPYSYAVAVAVKEYFETICLADVMITRDASDPYVDRTTRANLIQNFDADIALTMAFNTFNTNPATGIAEPWGWSGDGGVVAWSASNSASTNFGSLFQSNIPTYTGRPSRRALNPSSNLPYSSLENTAPAYAHVEMLFLDHNYDWVVINQQLSWVTDAVITSLLQQIEATPGIECAEPITYPDPPSAEDIERVKQLGYNNYQTYGTDPVNLSTGNYVASEKVFSLTGVGDQEIDLTLAYNALDGRAGPVGNGWNFAYSSRAQLYSNGAVMVTLADGRSVFFESDGAGGFVTPAGARTTLVGDETGAVLTFGDRTTLEFSFDEDTGYGTLVRAVDRQGNQYTLEYGPLQEAAEGEFTFPPLTSITDQAGQTVAVTSTASGRITGFTHPDGRQWTLGYDAAGNLTSITDGANRTRHFAYNADNLLVEVTGADGVKELTNVYDSDQRVVTQTDGAGYVRTIAYSEDHVTTLTDALGNVSRLDHNDDGQLVREVDQEGGSTRTYYDANSNPVTSIDANGNTHTSTFDVYGRVQSYTNPAGETTSYTYNSAGDLTSISSVAPTGATATTTLVLNADGRAVETHLPDGTVTYATYNSHGDVTSSTDANGNVTLFAYDARGNTVLTTDALGGETHATFDLANRLTSTTDTRGSTTTFVWNAADKVTSMTDALGNVTTYTYDVNDSLLSETDALGRTTTYEYNVNLQVTALTRPDGSRYSYEYDAEHRLIKQVNPDGTFRTFEYDGLGREIAKVDEAGERWLTEYDAIGNAIEMTDPQGGTTTVEYDAMSRAVKIINAEGGERTVQYRPTGLVGVETDEAGFSTSYDYDVMGRMVAVEYPDGSTESRTHDANGNVIAATDQRGLETTFEYDARNRMVSITDPRGGEWLTEFDSEGNTVRSVDARGFATTWELDALGRATSTTDALGGTATTTYNAVGDVLATTDALGRTTSFEYDAMSRVTSATQPDGTVVSFAYDIMGRASSTTDARGFVTSFAYDVVGNQVSTTDAAGGLWTNEYDVHSALIATEDPLGARTTWEYDLVGRVVAKTDAQGNRSEYHVDARGDMVSATDARGFVTQFERDSMRRVHRVTAADGGVTTYGFDAAGNVISKTDAEGHVTTYAYDALGQQTTTVDAEGGVWLTEYDAVGNPVAVTDATGARTETVYDALSRVVGTTDALGNVSWASYDAVGQLLARTDVMGRVTSFDYDPMGRVVSTTRPDGVTLTMQYNATGEVVSFTNARGFVTSIEVDALGREVARVDAAGERWLSEYDAVGNLIATEDPSGARTTMEYDALSRPTATVDALGNRSETAYNQVGAVASATDALGHATTYTYDEVNRLATVTTPQGAHTAFAYDLVGNRVSATDPVGSRVEFAFDGLGREVVREAPDGGVTTTAYDAASRVTAVTDPNGFTRTAEFDALGRVTRSTDGAGFATTYEYDAAGNLLNVTAPRGGVTQYAYDVLDRQISVTNAEGETVLTQFDAAGNAVAVVDEVGVESRRVYDPRDLLTVSIENFTVGAPADHVTNISTSVAYDERGLPVAVTDPRGNVTSYGLDALGRVVAEADALGQVTTTEFDALGRVARTIDPAGGVTAMTYSPDGYLLEVAYPDQTVEFSYDAAGRRIGMADSIGDSSWVYDWAGRAVADTDAQGNTTVREFDLAGNAARVEYADGRVTERTFDGRGLALTQTDATGLTAFTYDADGGLSQVERASGVDTEVTRDLVGRVTGIVHSGEGVTGTPLPSGAVNPSSMAPGNAYGHCKDNGNGHPNQQPAGCDTGVLAFEYVYDERGLVEGREIVTDETTTATDYVHDALGRLTQSVTGEYVAAYGWDAASNLISESVSEDLSTNKKNDGYTSTRSVNAINQLTQVVKDPHALPASHTVTEKFLYDGRGNRVAETTTRGTGNSAKVESLVTYAYDGMDQVVGVRDAGKNLNKTSDDVVTGFERDGLGRALTVTEGAVTRERLFDGHLLVASGDTQLVRDPFGGVLAELDQVVQGNGRWATMVTRQQDVLTDVLGSTVAVAVDGVIDADLRLFGDFGEELTEPGWDTVTGFTGKVDTAGLTEFVTRSYDVDARVWVSDDTYRGQVTRASSMNRYAYVEGAPESFVDHLGFFRAAAALEAQRLAAAEAAWLAAQKAARSAAPTNCSGYGCYMKWQAESPARFMAQQPLHVRGYAYALQVIAYADYQAQLKQYQAENYAFARAGTTREAEALRIYNEKLAIHHRWVAEQAGIEHERAQLLFYDTVTATAKTLSDPSTAIHLTLDVLGMIPVIGEPADGLNALIYLAEGDEVNAAISAAGMLPIGGMAATGARAVKTAVKTGLEAAAQISATSVTMLKVTPPAPTAVLKVDTSAATMPTAPVGAATPPAPKPADTVPATKPADAPTAAADAPLYVYRGGSDTATNLTPRPGKDTEGLSTFDTPEAAAPNGGKVQVIDTSRLNCLTACPDVAPPGHVTITPGSLEEVAEWAATRETDVVHEYTQELIGAIVEEIRLPKP